MSRIELERVELKEPAMSVPGVETGQYLGSHRILYSANSPNKRLAKEAHLLLWHDGDFLYVANPNRPGEPEILPLGRVGQMRAVVLQPEKQKK